jgi:C-3',4' desaturase CrtD
MKHIIVVGAGIGGLTTAALLAKLGHRVTVLESQVYPGGSAGTFFHKGYRFDAGATLAGGFQPETGPHALVGDWLDIEWPVRSAETAWVVHLPDHEVILSKDPTSLLKNFPQSAEFWNEQVGVADLSWSMAAMGLPFPPTSFAELAQIAKVGLAHFPRDLRLVRYAFATVYDWLKRHSLHTDGSFKRFIDAQLLISAQTTSDSANALYGATALDLARQGVQHVEGGIGSLAETLVDKIRELGGDVIYRMNVARIAVEHGRAIGVYATRGKRGPAEFFPADVVVANLTPWSLDKLLGENSPASLRREIKGYRPGWGAFVLHLGTDGQKLPDNLADHHQIVPHLDTPLGEGNSIFVSMSPEWDTSRAPEGHRAVTVTTHTAVQPWWDLLERDYHAYVERKQAYTEKIIGHIDDGIPGFRDSLELILPGTPVTYNFYTSRHRGMVGGFPQTSLLNARGPRVGIPNIRLVGDSIFPGQSTAGVTVGAIRVADDVSRLLGAAQDSRRQWMPESI